MSPVYEPHKILPIRLPAAGALLLAAALVAAWVMVHALRRRSDSRWRRGLLLAAGLGIGFLALLAALDVLQRVVSFATNWWLWPIALGGAAIVEALLLLYALERRIVPRRVGTALVALRLAMALLVVLMLAQPVRSVDLSRTLQRFVAVLVDDSASMHVPDSQMTPAERTRLAEALSPDVPVRPWRLERAATAVRPAREKLAAQADWFAALRDAKPEARQRQLEGSRKATVAALTEVRQAVADQIAAIAAPLQGKVALDARTTAAATALRDQLATEVHDRLGQALDQLAAGRLPMVARDPEPVLALLRGAAESLAKLGPRLIALGDALDEAFYNSLGSVDRARIDAVALKERFALAQDLLHRAAKEPGAPRRGLLGDLRADYGVRLYTFAAAPAEVNVTEGLHQTPRPAPAKQEPGAKEPSPKAAELPAEQQKTDIAAALEKVLTEMPEDRLAGIVMLTDGQHNAASRVEPLARRIGLKQLPVSSIVFGGSVKPTVDAAVVGIEAPETVYTKDKVYIHADLKLDGLAGKTVRVTLYDGDQPVDSDEVKVESDKLRTRVQLADEPRDSGLHAYRVKVEDVQGEVLASNNEHGLSVSVTDDQTRLLLVEGRPRWEFRYLKNLFASRDKTVKLQYVVLHPDEIPGQPPRPRVHASAARPKDEPEATHLPENEAEWMKFDVIVLGDVEPEALKDEHMKALRRFVEDRAGTLIVIAGPRHMPHAYANTPLADLLPVTLKADAQPEPWLRSPDDSFRIELTPEGREHVITRLKVDPAESLEVWASLPDLHWRHPIATTKEGAMVLAYALPPTPPDFLRPKADSEVPSEEVIRQRQQFIREHALLAIHNAALGRVMFLATDHTWRLRYRVGDTHHHRFWGQVLRWATADKLPAGTSLVKLGTDRPRYSPDQPVRVRARLTQPDLTPIQSDDVFAVVTQADKVVLRKKMEFVPRSQGLYNADLGKLDGGTYRVELEAPAAKGLLAAENVEKVATDFYVEPAIPAEQIELSANRGLLESIASLTNGAVADVAHAADALAALREPRLLLPDRREWSLWNSWPLLALIIALGGAEWFIRKRARLA
ncbi:MAG TPA: hypothetical protein PLE19_03430 [Planctomycetota bacterium]|nr:hypothetical protein [Planctomycetota bacterium]HRR79597.1 hypothetical protein [Planctomycetota bacterium]HRT95026.1 hypothetical protein [Planctomycetota bacterium]